MSGSITLSGGWVVRWFYGSAAPVLPLHPSCRMSWALYDSTGRVALGDACEIRFWPGRLAFLTRSAAAGAL